MGVPVLKNVKKKRLEKIEAWIETSERVQVVYENIAEAAVTRALSLIH
jgi:hypothetical protein